MSAKIYFAGPLFTSAERKWNEWFASALRRSGIEIVLPQEEAERYISESGVDYAGIFAMCLDGIRSASAILAVFDGVDVDSGTAFECGYAYALGKPVVGLRTDLRSGGEENGLNAMLARCCSRLLAIPAIRNDEHVVHAVVETIRSL
jgi:nucleoside 2-deoxyribosyltransferase